MAMDTRPCSTPSPTFRSSLRRPLIGGPFAKWCPLQTRSICTNVVSESTCVQVGCKQFCPFSKCGNKAQFPSPRACDRQPPRSVLVGQSRPFGTAVLVSGAPRPNSDHNGGDGFFLAHWAATELGSK